MSNTTKYVLIGVGVVAVVGVVAYAVSANAANQPTVTPLPSGGGSQQTGGGGQDSGNVGERLVSGLSNIGLEITRGINQRALRSAEEAESKTGGDEQANYDPVAARRAKGRPE